MSNLQTHSTPTIQGIFEVGIGTPDLIAQIHYWQQFGYRISQVGELSAGAYQPVHINLRTNKDPVKDSLQNLR